MTFAKVALVAVLAILVGCTTATPAGLGEPTPPPPAIETFEIVDEVWVFGDSITVGSYQPPGWPHYADPSWVNHGEGGAGFVWVGIEGHSIPQNIWRISAACECLPRTMYVTGGANDAVYAASYLDDVLDNIRGIQLLFDTLGTDLIWVTPPYVRSATANATLDQIHYLMESFPNSIDAGDALCRPLCSVFDLGDGVHLTELGDSTFAGRVAPGVSRYEGGLVHWATS